MNYKLYENETQTSDILEHILWNRGITDAKKYLALSDDVIEDYLKLDNIIQAKELFLKHFNKRSPIAILVDVDPDGYTSAASMYSYIKRLDPEYPVTYILHTESKSHGLGNDVYIPEGTKLLIIPDAGTNDVQQCKQLNNTMDIIILDHHEAERKSLEKIEENAKGNGTYATIVVNNQMSQQYANKDLSGVGVVYRFLQCLDDELWTDYADEFLDLVALGNISDVMKMTSFETRRLVEKGLSSVTNKCFASLIAAQDYSMGGRVNIHNVQWYITPILNGMIRVGSNNEKEILFRAFIEQDEFFEYKKRATKNRPAEVVMESIYDRAARLCKNAKSRQDKIRDKGVSAICEEVDKSFQTDDKVIMVDISEIIENKGLSGVLAIKIAELYQRPCILLKKYENAKKQIVYGGSARNIDHSPIENFKEVVNRTGIFNFAQGHPNAFGQELDVNRLEEAKASLNAALKDVVFDPTYIVDYIFDVNDLEVGIIQEMTKLEDYIGQGINEPMIAVEGIHLDRSDIYLYGKTSNTLTFTLPNGIKVVQFFCKEGNALYDWVNDLWADDESITIDIVGTPSINEYQGVRTPQVVIIDSNIRERTILDLINTEDDFF